MRFAASAIFLLVLAVAQRQLEATKIVCPQAVANDPNPPFCASNAYGQLDVTRSAFENWNCNHPFNKYVAVSQIACDPEPVAPTCDPDTCDQVGPIVCGRLRSPSPQWPNANTAAVFGNQCQLTLYNCMNPTQTYVADTRVTTAEKCTSVGL